MNAKQVLKKLESLGTAQNRKVYARHGVREPFFGVSYGDLGRLAKELKGEHEIAMDLWASANHDARVLATMIADPERMSAREFMSWGRELENYVLAEAVVRVASRSPKSEAVMKKWLASPSEWARSAGWSLLACRLNEGDELEEREVRGYLASIEKGIHSAKNRVRHAMNGALIGIGVGVPGLRVEALAAAKRIGEVEVDHGETGCKTPDAGSYIRKTLTHLGKKAAARRKG